MYSSTAIAFQWLQTRALTFRGNSKRDWLVGSLFWQLLPARLFKLQNCQIILTETFSGIRRKPAPARSLPLGTADRPSELRRQRDSKYGFPPGAPGSPCTPIAVSARNRPVVYPCHKDQDTGRWMQVAIRSCGALPAAAAQLVTDCIFVYTSRSWHSLRAHNGPRPPAGFCPGYSQHAEHCSAGPSA